VSLETEEKTGRHGVTRDLSSNGLLIVTPSRFSPGEKVGVKVLVGGVETSMEGRIARVDVNPISSPELWRYRVGVALAAPLPIEKIEQGLARVRIA
jgi:hypothetical protein